MTSKLKKILGSSMSQKGVQWLAILEGRKKKAYDDATGKEIKSGLALLGKPTIGVGHLIKPNEKNLLIAFLTDAQVDELFKTDLKIIPFGITNQQGNGLQSILCAFQ